MLTPAEFSRQCDERDRALKGGVTPLHSACEAGMDGPDDEEDQGEEVRRRVQYQADPVPAGPSRGVRSGSREAVQPGIRYAFGVSGYEHGEP